MLGHGLFDGLEIADKTEEYAARSTLDVGNFGLKPNLKSDSASL